jgi:cysteine desulfurase
MLGVSPNEIVFTSGGTESNNLALRGVMSARRSQGRRVVVSALEHPSVLATAEALQRDGCEVANVPVDSTGTVDPGQIEASIVPGTVLVSVLHASNEVGTVQPIAEIGATCRKHGVYFHTDAVQTAGKLPLCRESLEMIDLLSLSGHKFYGPRGTGVLFVRSRPRVKMDAQVTGGGQEKNRRAGTENVAGIVGLAEALRLSVEHSQDDAMRETMLRTQLVETILYSVPDVILTGHPSNRIPGHASFCFRGVEGEAVLLALDAEGFVVSSGSACSAGTLEPPHALRAMGIPDDYARGSVRITVGRSNTTEEIALLCEAVPQVIGRLRSLRK